MPSPPHTTSGVDPVGDALAGQVERLAGVTALEVAHGRARRRAAG